MNGFIGLCSVFQHVFKKIHTIYIYITSYWFDNAYNNNVFIIPYFEHKKGIDSFLFRALITVYVDFTTQIVWTVIEKLLDLMKLYC